MKNLTCIYSDIFYPSGIPNEGESTTTGSKTVPTNTVTTSTTTPIAGEITTKEATTLTEGNIMIISMFISVSMKMLPFQYNM